MGEGKGFLGDLAAISVFEIVVGAGFAFTFALDGGRGSFQEESVFLQDDPDSELC